MNYAAQKADFDRIVARAGASASRASRAGAEIHTALRNAQRSGLSKQEIEKLREALVQEKLRELDSLTKEK